MITSAWMAWFRAVLSGSQELASPAVLSVLVVTSDYEEVVQVADRAVVMARGRVSANLTSEEITVEKVQALITRAPFHQWLGLQVVAVTDDGIELKAKWREEWVVNPDRRYTHGGILAALVDLAADWALVKRTGRGVPTIDMRIDYHAAAMPGDLTIKGRVIRAGSQFSTAEAFVHDADGKLLASGRGTYFTAPPK